MSLLVAAAALGGCSNDSFICLTDVDCGAMNGACELNGYCSFPADECASGRRFGDTNPQSIAGKCVPEGEGGTESAAEVTTTSGSSSSTTTLSSTSSTSSTSSSTTSADASTSTSTSSDESDATSSTTTDPGTDTSDPPLMGCGAARELLVDTFDDDSGPWILFGPLAAEFDGTLLMDLDSVIDAFGFGGVISEPTTQLAGVLATAELIEAPAAAGDGETFFELSRDEGLGGTVGFNIGQGRLSALREVADGPREVVGEVDFDAISHRWFRVAAEGDEIVWLTSADGMQFEELGRADFPNELDGYFVSFIGLEGDGEVDPGDARWDNVSFCDRS